MEYILTFDIGIKNLAYCICHSDTNINENLRIIDWNIIDFSFKHKLCNHLKPKSKICNKKAIFYNMNEEYLCKEHGEFIKKLDLVNFKKFKRISKNNVLKDTFNKTMDRLLSALNELYTKLLIPYDNDNSLQFINNLNICIENQPALKNPIMKSISIVLYSFFKIKKLENNTLINTIDFINANNKTKDSFLIKIMKKEDIPEIINYKDRKQFAIDLVNNILKNINKKDVLNLININNYDIINKKDDLADTFIYVLYYLFR